MNYETRDIYGIYRNDSGSAPGAMLMGANTLLGTRVYNLQGEDIGELKEIMMDFASGNMCYAVLAFNEFSEKGEQFFAVPWGALVLDTHRKSVVLDVDKELLKRTNGFDKNHWPNMADQHWAGTLHAGYASPT